MKYIFLRKVIITGLAIYGAICLKRKLDKKFIIEVRVKKSNL